MMLMNVPRNVLMFVTTMSSNIRNQLATLSNWMRLNAPAPDVLTKNEAGRLGQRAVFGFRPLDAAGSPQHVEIAHGARTGFRIRRERLRYDPFDNDQLAAGWKRIAAIAQDDPATIVLPIVDDALHHDRVGAAWDRFETVRYLGIGVDDALAIAEQVDV
jgi:hypothetical protein